jgi:hypothetical protein
MPDKKPTWEQARIRQHEADIVRSVADERDESFIQALYHIIQFYGDYKKGLISCYLTSSIDVLPKSSQKNEPPTPNQSEVVGNVDDLDVSDFE